MLGKIKSITVVNDLELENTGNLNGKNSSKLGMMGMLSSIIGYGSYDGYKVETENNTYHILIDNRQCCCEDWGYMTSEDDLNYFIGSDLIEVNLVDIANEKIKLDIDQMYLEDGGIQFVDFVTNNGVFQLAVYNEHNGYYGHSIIIAKDTEILLSDTL